MLPDTYLRERRRLASLSDAERLWWAEFGDPVEVAARIFIMPAAGVGIWAHTGHVYGLIWAAIYLIFVALSYGVMHPSRSATRANNRIGIACYVLTACTFLTVPLYLVTLPDFTLKLAGALGLLAYMAFNLFRDEPPRSIEPWDLAMGGSVIFVVWLAHVPQNASIVVQVVLTALCCLVGFYYTLAIRKTRRSLRDLRLAAARGVEAQKMEALGRLSGGVAHDFNNILTVIRGNLDLYSEVQSEAERAAVLAEAQRAVDRAAGLVTQLLAFARRAPLATEELELGGVVSDVTEMAKRLLPETIALYEETPAGMVYARLDPAQFNSALLNLILNARDAMDGRGRIDLSARVVAGSPSDPEETEGQHIRVAVRDTGPGLSDEVLEKAFEPFFTTKKVGEGSGLGLSMVKGFAEQSGGRVSVETGTTGTVFALHLPKADRSGGSAPHETGSLQ